MNQKIKYGVYIANFSIFDSPNDYVELAVEAENHSWDGFFMWDHTIGSRGKPAAEPYTTLSAIAVKTERIFLGTTVTGLPRHKPWTLARQITTIDHLSKGRFILGVGLGAPEEYEMFHEPSDPIILKEKVEESLEIIIGLLRNKRFSFSGKHYQVNEVNFQPKPLQHPIPIWIGGEWPHKGPMKRAAQYQGVFPIHAGSDDILTPTDIVNILTYIKKYRPSLENFDVVMLMFTTGDKVKDAWIKNYIEVGVTWLVEVIYPGRGSKEEIFQRIRLGPPT